MAKITAINVKGLTNDDAYGFMNEVVRQLKDSFKTLPEVASVFVASLGQYNEALKGEEASFSSSDLYEADAKADKAWAGLNGYLKAMLNCPDDAVRTAAESVWNVFSKYENPTEKPFATEYGIIERLLNDLNTIPDETRQKANAQVWIDHLVQCSSAFTTMYSLRVQEQAHKVTGNTKTAKFKAVDDYREMVKVMNALLIVSPTTELVDFSDHINQLIESKQIVLKARKTRVANAKSDESEKG